MTDVVRRDLLARTLLEVLRDADAPMQPAEALQRVTERQPFTPHEASLNNSGYRRAETFLRFVSSWATTVGWMTKKGGWALTEAGAAALDQGGDLYSRVSKLYRAIMKEKKPAETVGESPKFAKVREALDLVEPGLWTAYSDLGKYAGLPNQTIGGWMAKMPFDNAHRVLQADGRISPGFTWSDPTRHDDPRSLLESEGVSFDAAGRASQADRISAEDFVEMLGSGDTSEATSRRAWLVRGSSVAGINLVPTWLAEGWCSLAASQLRVLEPPVSRDEIQDAVESDYSHLSYNARREKLSDVDTFFNRIGEGDLVVANDGGQIHLGEVTGEPTMLRSPDERSNLRRSVTWLTRHSPIDFAELPSALTAKLSSQHTIVDLTQQLATLEALLPGEAGVQPSTVTAAVHSLRDATTELSEDLLVDRHWLDECIELLRDRRQIIFYGPPGTGKTYLAHKIAKHAAGADDRVKLVQFHPAYSYEDFFEGYRPVAGNEAETSVGFRLMPGPFRRLVDAARENPSQPYVLIIDEINRANLAKVFGELYFLLEYRDEAIDLLYSSGDEAGFTMPDNVYLIGTMNTADRSIALVDAAMRRRFAFLPLHPSEPPTSDLLRRWLRRQDLPESTADILDELNRRIIDEDYKIGPSYFMRPSVHAEGGLERVWRTAILPLLEEHHFGDGLDVAKRYSLTSVRRAVQPPSTADDVGGAVSAGEPDVAEP